MNYKLVDILLLEDNEDDIQYLKNVISIDSQLNLVHIAKDCDEALAYLKCEGKYSQAHKPGLILLDADVSNHQGLDLLHKIRNFPELCRISVAVLTSDKCDEEEVRSCSDELSFVVKKPIEYSEVKNTFKEYSLYWELIASEPHLAEQVG